MARSRTHARLADSGSQCIAKECSIGARWLAYFASQSAANVEDRKLVEQRYYDRKARLSIDPKPSDAREPLGADAMPRLLRAPYLEFERRVREVLRPEDVVLDVGAGTGIHSLLASGDRRQLIAVDFSLDALAIARRRAATHSVPLHVLCGDGERLPLANASVDVVTTAGILYCVDLAALLSEIRRVLRPHGTWILVDSFDHNPIYRLNRFLGYLRRRRTKRALTNMPNKQTLARLRREFRRVEVSYHGIFAFLGPVMRPFIGVRKAERFLNHLDRATPMMQQFAFKIVVTVSRPVAHSE